MLSADERRRVEERLREERQRAIELLDGFDATREKSLQEDMGELSVYRFHPADLGTEMMEKEKQFLLASSEGRHLYEIDDALRRLYRDPEGFGSCGRCGKSIAMERLEVVPEATLCAECQRVVEE